MAGPHLKIYTKTKARLPARTRAYAHATPPRPAIHTELHSVGLTPRRPTRRLCRARIQSISPMPGAVD